VKLCLCTVALRLGFGYAGTLLSDLRTLGTGVCCFAVLVGSCLAAATKLTLPLLHADASTRA